jgi:hypothetical protein
MAELEPIENLELLYTSNYIYKNEAKAILAELDGSSVLASEVPHANANALETPHAKSFKSVKYSIHLTCHIYKHFEHSFGSI